MTQSTTAAPASQNAARSSADTNSTGLAPKEKICPGCGTDLHVVVREEIEVDVCPKCRGVWLDRGELDKIIARTFSSYVEVLEDASADGAVTRSRRSGRWRFLRDFFLSE